MQIHTDGRDKLGRNKFGPYDTRFLQACYRQPVDATPIWLMRQAGRYMAEYRTLREKYGILEIIKTPALAWDCN
jgi:uroporphyrinogen-III decarboxylase